MAGNLSDCVPSIINGKLIWYTWKNEFNTFYEINLSDLSVNKAVKIENGHKYIYDSNVTTDGLTTETCTVCGKTETVALPVKIALYKKGPGDSSFYLQQKDSFPLTIDDSVQLVWNPSVADGDSTYKKIYDCEISSTDDSILSITGWPSSKIVTMTAHKQGTAAIIIQSKYNPNAVLKVNVYVNTINEQTSSMSLSSTLFHYDGEEHTPTVTLKSGNKTLTEGTDFEVSYEGDLVNAGTVTVTATGIGSYTGSISKTYKIDTRSISNARVSVAPAYYTGFEVTPEVTVTYEDEILVLDRDYTVVYQNNINRYSNSRVGIQGIGNYTGYMTKSFSILRGDISNFTVTLSQDSLEYTGFRLIPDVTVASEYGE